MKFTASFILFTFFTCSTFAKTKGTDAVAEVNGSKISKSEFDQTFHQSELFVGHAKTSKETVLTDLINRQLGLQKAKKNNLMDNEEVKRKIEDVLFHAQISKDLENEFKKIQVKENNMKDYYKNHMEYRTAHILLRIPAKPTKELIDETQKKIFEIYDLVKEKPEKFNQLANRYSQTTASANGGDIGFQPAVKLPSSYYNAIHGKGAGYITTPVRTKFGYHIIKVLSVKNYENINKKIYQKIVYDSQRDKMIENYFAGLRRTASIKINEKLIK
jgi:parvulin-like peptidyl-prolyl isomerase